MAKANTVPTINLTAWHYMVITESEKGARPQVSAQGQVVHPMGADRWLVRFHSPSPYMRILSTESLQQGILFRTDEEMDAFAAAVLGVQQEAPPPASDEPELPPDETSEDVGTAVAAETATD
jgi:hypothetical protein